MLAHDETLTVDDLGGVIVDDRAIRVLVGTIDGAPMTWLVIEGESVPLLPFALAPTTVTLLRHALTKAALCMSRHITY